MQHRFSVVLLMALIAWPKASLADDRSIEVIRDSVQPHWTADGRWFWFKSRLKNQQSQYWLIDAASGSRQELFDHQKVADAIQQQTGKNVNPFDLPISVLRFDSESQEVELAAAERLLVFDRVQSTLDWRGGGRIETSVPGRFFLPPEPSGTAGESVLFCITNRLEHAIEVAWIDSQSNPRVYAKLEPGESFQSDSYVDHVWLIRKLDAQPLAALRLNSEVETRLLIDLAALEDVQLRQIESPEHRSQQEEQTDQAGYSISPDGKYAIEVQAHNLWSYPVKQSVDSIPHGPSSGDQPVLTSKEAGQQLTSDATEHNSFRRSAQPARLIHMQYSIKDYSESTPHIDWSPDSQYLLAWQTTVVPERLVYAIRSLTEQVQPELTSFPYAKPGDVLPCSRPRLFRAVDGAEIPISTELFSHPWEVRLEKFSSDGRYAWLFHNARGHQQLQIIQIELTTGKHRVIIDEQSSTFLHYSVPGKYQLWWLDETTALWSSERTGWNHLYRIDMLTGQVLSNITSGQWNVKRVEKVDSEHVWFYAVGIVEDQDPYHEHYCRASLNGKDLTRLTRGDGMHSIKHSPTGEYILDHYSRVDLPPVVELRRADDGSLICEVERAELVVTAEPKAQSIDLQRWLPLRFVAPGRDGKTPIWGVVYWPENFDPNSCYPVIESIYAGPHDHHVPKEFQRVQPHREFTSAGFVVVKIDGMGTAWRSKAFHDVCYRNLRDAGFPDRIAWLRALADQYPCMDLQRVGIFGGSAGGQNAMAALLWHNDFCRVAVADCGCHDNRMDKVWWNEQWLGKLEPGDHYARNSNAENAHLLKGRLMLVVGELDQNVDPASTLQVVARLIQADKDFQFLMVPGTGHGACETPYARKRRLEFFRQHLLTERHGCSHAESSPAVSHDPLN